MTAQADQHVRAVLEKAAQENFPVAPRMLPRAWRRDLMAVYGYARLVDDIGDGDLAPGGRDAAVLGLTSAEADDRLVLLDALEADLHRVFDATGRARGGPRHPLLAALEPAVRERGVPREPFLALIDANRQDQKVRRYETFAGLVRYCELSANPVGRLVLAVTGTATPERVRHSDAICTALQVVEHLQDVAEDLRRDRIYLPGEDMARFGVSEADLGAPSAGASLRALIAYECARAQRLLGQGSPLVRTVEGRLRLLLAGYVGGGRATLAAIRRAGYDVLPGPPKPTTAGLLRGVGTALRREG
ncbi:squalene synthase HpnC [Streptomyces sp. TR06-5]|uniref:squalene synthase HpnC n=1 Tax=unclassified Streptomyces TaxID=2593676 RepID=UPI0039A1FF15